jgi:peptidyl-prolyl cis-trans isomerase A (cyclophilin A)/peptidyl-prolyl cis-trans isomerase B (cyclophilin B)
MGEIVLELAPEKAPKTVENFLDYVKAGHYNGTIFHRVIDGFMIQGGGFDKDMKEKPTKAPIKNEAANGLKNERYSVAMARTNAPHSASAFLDYPSRDGWGYAVFGKVVKGMDVVDQITATKTADRGPYQNVPVKPVVIESAKIVR